MASMLIELAMAAHQLPIGAEHVVGSIAPVQLAGGLAFHAKPGDTLSGNLVLETSPAKDLEVNSSGIELFFRGEEHTSITVQQSNGGKGGSHRRTFTGGSELFRVNMPPVTSARTFQRGLTYKFPFQFHVPVTPHSLQYALGQEGTCPEEDSYCCAVQQRRHECTVTIKYEIKAVCHVAGIFTKNVLAQIDVIVDPVFPAAPQPSGLTATTAQGRVTIPNYLCCDCFGYKPISADVTIPKVAFTNGEQTNITLHIKNDSDNQITGATFALQNRITIKVSDWNANPRSVTRFVTCHRVVGAFQISPHSEQTIQQPLQIQGMTPDVATSCFGANSFLLVKVQVQGFRKPINVRIPLHSPYSAGHVLVPVPGQALAVNSPASFLPQAPLQQTMGDPAKSPMMMSQQQMTPYPAQPVYAQPPMQPGYAPPPQYANAPPAYGYPPQQHSYPPQQHPASPVGYAPAQPAPVLPNTTQ